MNNLPHVELEFAANWTPIVVQSQDSVQTSGIETAYDSIWGAVPVADPSPLEKIMLAEDKLFVVLAVVLVIWFGIVAMLFRTDRKIRNIERRLADDEHARNETLGK